MSVSHIPVAIWRKPSPDPTYHSQYNVNLELVKHFINLDDGLPTQSSEEKKFKRSPTPSKIPILVRSSLTQRHLDGHLSQNSVDTSSERSSSSISPSSSSSSSSPSEKLSMFPKLEEKSHAIDLISTFPSFKSHRFREHLNWMKNSGNGMTIPFRNVKEILRVIDHYKRIQSAYNIINEVTQYFLQEGVPKGDTQNDPYSMDLLQNELDKEERYQLLFSSETSKTVYINSMLREKVVEWIISAASQFKYSVDTVYLATYFIDAFLHERTIKTTCWPLLGLTAFQIAGKIEEKSCVHLPTIWKKYKNLVKISRDEVEWMEVEIMRAVKFHMMPTTSKLFADLAFASGCITFPCTKSEQIIKDLSYKILLNSLQNHELSYIRSSYKAELAIKIATEYIMFYHFVFLRDRTTRVDSEINSNAEKICCALFRTILFQSEEPNR